MTQISVDNVHAVHALLVNQAARMSKALAEANWLRNIPAVAADPVSRDGRDAFQPKIDKILDVHWAHYFEVQEAADRLRQAAREYGHTDEAVEAAVTRARERFAHPA